MQHRESTLRKRWLWCGVLLLAGPVLAAEQPDATAEDGQESAAEVIAQEPVDALIEDTGDVARYRARDIDLDAPLSEPLTSEGLALHESLLQASKSFLGRVARSLDEAMTTMPPDVETRPPFVLLGGAVEAGTSTRLAWEPGTSFAGIAVPTPVLVVNGVESGPVLCLTAAVHGDELNGIEMVRRVLYSLDPAKLRGTVVGVPIVNLLGFKRSSRYLPDRRDLNRYFPGNPNGSSASRIAYSFFTEVISSCDLLLDLHTGSFSRSNLPQLRADLDHPEVRVLAKSFGDTVVVYSRGARGTLRRAAVDAGIPAVTLEAGEPLRFQVEEVEKGVERVFAAMDQFSMYRRARVWGNPSPVFYRSRWVRADAGGILLGDVTLGQQVSRGDSLGRVVDPITNISAEVLAPWNGRVIGMAVDQVVLPGFAAFHIGIESPPEEGDVWAEETDAGDNTAALNGDTMHNEGLDDS